MAERQTIRQKIQELFAYRRIPELLNLAGIEKDSPFLARLYKLQEVIYALDTYLETHWDVKKKELKTHWNEIYNALSSLGIPVRDHSRYVKEIKRYEKYELDLRKKKLPLNKSFETLYGCKSCDVKLMRKLIYRHAPDLKQKLREKEWKYYDLITEVNDDIHDVFEDCETLNGNRFLISVLVRGKGKTRRAYRDFLDATGKEAIKYFKKKKDPHHNQLFKWTRERLRETEELLQETMDGQRLYLVDHSAIAAKIG